MLCPGRCRRLSGWTGSTRIRGTSASEWTRQLNEFESNSNNRIIPIIRVTRWPSGFMSTCQNSVPWKIPDYPSSTALPLLYRYTYFYQPVLRSSFLPRVDELVIHEVERGVSGKGVEIDLRVDSDRTWPLTGCGVSSSLSRVFLQVQDALLPDDAGGGGRGASVGDGGPQVLRKTGK